MELASLPLPCFCRCCATRAARASAVFARALSAAAALASRWKAASAASACALAARMYESAGTYIIDRDGVLHISGAVSLLTHSFVQFVQTPLAHNLLEEVTGCGTGSAFNKRSTGLR